MADSQEDLYYLHAFCSIFFEAELIILHQLELKKLKSCIFNYICILRFTQFKLITLKAFLQVNIYLSRALHLD